MLQAAGTALYLVADGTIIAFGRLASTLRLEHRHIYDGDRQPPHRSSWQEAMAEIETALALARTNRDAAPAALDLAQPRLSNPRPVEEERAFLLGVGVEYARLLNQQGTSLGWIAAKTGIPKTSLHRYLAEHPPSPRRPETHGDLDP
ncbi:hypothetical protein [Streptomyces sp. SAS_270]|uniref:hypothetical protein n=1 Tax=Streptomyces sp. SAS_270 TaxID=3412748 RepID=UPI00403D029B